MPEKESMYKSPQRQDTPSLCKSDVAGRIQEKDVEQGIEGKDEQEALTGRTCIRYDEIFDG